ncbi:MAG: pyridoxal kinase PdxY [Alphaproteobacteria bacterium]
MPPPAILSIQSHVAFGHVGNAAAVFPMQRLGYEVWPIHTVMFSNHTGYPSFRGPVFAPDDLARVVLGMDERGVFGGCAAVLSGYMGTPALGEVILDAVARVRAASPAAFYCCDPVMGDVGRGVFVRAGIPEFMAARAVPAARVVTPNQFELELMTGTRTDTLAAALAATAMLRAGGPEWVLVTSLIRSDAPDDAIEMLLAGADGAWLIRTPRLEFPIAPNGSGDATTALFLAHLLRHGSGQAALEAATEAIYAIFEATAAAGTRELQLIAAQDAIASSRPGGRFRAAKVA